MSFLGVNQDGRLEVQAVALTILVCFENNCLGLVVLTDGVSERWV